MPTYFLLTCQHCNSEFNVLSRDKSRKFCSSECSNESRRRLPKESNCLHCGNKLNRGQYKFCCQSCSASYNNKGVRRRGKSLEEKAKPCAVCNKTIYKGKYCSKECMSIAYTKYTPELQKAKRKEINRIGQSKYRSKNLRHHDPTANIELLVLIYSKCPDGWEVDHIIPLSKGGKHHENNLQYLPALENRSKGNRLIYSAINREYSVRQIINEYFK